MTTLAQYVRAVQQDTDYVKSCETQAEALVDQHIGDRTVPDEIRERAILEVGADLYYRRQARNGIAGLDSSEMSAAPMRIRNDALKAGQYLLAPYLGPGIA